MEDSDSDGGGGGGGWGDRWQTYLHIRQRLPVGPRDPPRNLAAALQVEFVHLFRDVVAEDALTPANALLKP